MARTQKIEERRVKSEERNDEEKSPAGRPPGSITSKTGSVHEKNATCRECRSSDLRRKTVTNDIEHHQVHEDGIVTTRRKWTRAMCQKCGTWQTVITDYNP